ncbi:paraquat-inducible protein A [Paraferrimonas sedimenticola]|uniref:paraquat-inducible protein A n=1 Tax=Paraferrimonas sedimenticola TaxID=375674 RepID=UPI000BA95948|nr:paraquat-inducible protein A [Paraferrimonas sedimenticola]
MSDNIKQSNTLANEQVLLCRSCDKVLTVPTLSSEQRAYCPRCKTRVLDNSDCPMHALLALSLASLVMFFPANFLPLLEVHFFGSIREATVTQGALSVIDLGYWLVGVSVLICAVVAPGLLILSLITQVLLISTKRPLSPWRKSLLLNLLRTHGALTQFTMLEIYLISFFVSVFKLTDFSDVYYGVGTYSFVALFVFLFYAQREYNPELFWRRYHEQCG